MRLLLRCGCCPPGKEQVKKACPDDMMESLKRLFAETCFAEGTACGNVLCGKEPVHDDTDL